MKYIHWELRKREMKVFVSYSFDPKDEEVANHFVNVFSAAIPDAEFITAKEPKAIPIAKKIDKAIDNCDCLLVILTNKHKLDNGKYIPPPWCLSEIGKAQGKNLPYFCFIEKEIDKAKLGSAIEIEGFTFSRNKLPVKDVNKYIGSLISNTGILTTGAYQFNLYDTHTVIFNNGHGIVNSRITLKVFKKTDSIQHTIDLGDVKKSAEFKKGLKGLIKMPISKRFNEQHLCAQVISSTPAIKGLSLSIKPSKHLQETKTMIPFLLSFNKPIPEGCEVNYTLGWSSPFMHFTKDADRKKENKPHPTSVLTAKHPIRKIVKRISFERGISLKIQPHMTVRDMNSKIEHREPFDFSEDTYYLRYKYETESVLRNAEYIADWKLK